MRTAFNPESALAGLLQVGLVLTAVFLAVRSWWRAGYEHRVVRAMRAKLPCDVGSIRDGELVKVVGVIEPPDQPLIAPLSGRACVYYEVIAETNYSHDNKTLAWESSGRDFVLRDSSGQIQVHLEGARVVVAPDNQWQYAEEPEPAQRALLERAGVSIKHPLVGWTPTRFSEGVFEPGEEVAVCGVARREAGFEGDGPYRGGGMPTLSLCATRRSPLLISDYLGARWAIN
jgi:hypothetical protein